MKYSINVLFFLWAIPIGTFIYGLFITFFPKFLEIANLTPFFIGLIFSTAHFSSGFSNILGSFLCDKYGRKVTYLIGLLFEIIAFLFLFIFFFSFFALFLFSIFLGMSMGVSDVAANLIISESTTKKQRTWIFSLIYFGSIAASISPLITGIILEAMGYISGFKVIISLVLIYLIAEAIFCFYFLKETLKRIKIRFKFAFSSLLNLFSIKIRKYLLFFFIVSIVYSFSLPFIILFILNVKNFSTIDFGILMSLISLIGCFSSLIGGKLAQKIKKEQILLFSFILSIFSNLVLIFSNNFIHLIIYAILEGLHYISAPVFIPLIFEKSSKLYKAKAIGMLNFLMLIGSSMGPFIGGILYSFNPYLPFITTISLLILLSFIGLKIL